MTFKTIIYLLCLTSVHTLAEDVTYFEYLSGDSTGCMDVREHCLESHDYPDNYSPSKDCHYEVQHNGFLTFTSDSYEIESGYDLLYINDIVYNGRHSTSESILVRSNDTIRWDTDYDNWGTWKGFQLCLNPDTSSINACGNQEGTNLNTDTCMCGSDLCYPNQLCNDGTCSLLNCGNQQGDEAWPCMWSGDDIVQQTTATCGAMMLTNIVQCNAAATSLGLPDVVADEVSVSNHPSGCFFFAGVRLYYNTLSTSTATCSENSECLCIAAPACKEGFNNDTCLCGTSTCTEHSGRVCYAEHSFCSTSSINVCGNQEGTDLNTDVCMCGSDLCYPNQLCNDGTCSLPNCGNQQGGEACMWSGDDIVQQTTATCVMLTNIAQCNAAATSLGLPDKVALQESESVYPPGCYYHSSNNLYYNTLSTSTVTCSENSECLCIAAPDCTHTNGATSNTDACLCGETGLCTADSGLYCTSSTNTCSSGDPCTNVYGSSLNTGADCSCGTGACNSFNGMYCYAEGNECSTTAFSNLCPIRNGSAANSVACTCGSVECTSTTGLICYSTYGGGSCRNTGFGAFGYIKAEGDTTCGFVSNRQSLPDKAACDAAATSMDLDDVVAENVISHNSNFPQGCYMRGGSSVFYNTLSTSTASCRSTDFCLCITASTCKEGSNNDTCLCGASTCTEHSGRVCEADTDTCSFPQCTHDSPSSSTYGSNSDTCLCGNTQCSANQFCYAEHSFCSTSSVNACGYQDGTNLNTDACMCGSDLCYPNQLCNDGTCSLPNCGNQQGGEACMWSGDDIVQQTTATCAMMLPNIAQCNAAATSLGLDDVVATPESTSYYPPGCYYLSNKYLYYNTLSTSTVTCSENSKCLCLPKECNELSSEYDHLGCGCDSWLQCDICYPIACVPLKAAHSTRCSCNE